MLELVTAFAQQLKVAILVVRSIVIAVVHSPARSTYANEVFVTALTIPALFFDLMTTFLEVTDPCLILGVVTPGLVCTTPSYAYFFSLLDSLTIAVLLMAFFIVLFRTCGAELRCWPCGIVSSTTIITATV